MSDGGTPESVVTEETVPTFGEAMAELEAILERIEGEEVDVDSLAKELRRAANLLEICRSKIRHAEVEVNEIVQNLEDADEGATTASDESPYGSTSSDDYSEPDDDDIPF